MMLREDLQRNDSRHHFVRSWKPTTRTSRRDWIVIESKRHGRVFIDESKISPKEKAIGLARIYALAGPTKKRRSTISASKASIALITQRQHSLDHIAEAIQESRKILQLQDDWDTEGGSVYSEATWERATNFLLKNAQRLLEKHEVSIPAPSILPGPDGSIDILWKCQDYELLVNIPDETSAQASFYGDTKTGGFIKGKLDISRYNKGFLTWLMADK